MKEKVVTLEAALEKFQDGQTIMFGDWHGELSAEEIITGLLEKGVKDIEAIAVSGGMPDQGVGRLINEHRVNKLITTHIGLNPVAGQQMFAGELEVEFVPQGTFAERVRCGGAGLGGVLTPTGIGTDVERGKQRLIIDGKEYLLERPVRADVALIYGSVADKYGNVKIHGTARNFNTVMAAAADTVICQADEVVEMIDPDEVLIQGVLVDYIVGGKN